MSQSLAQLYVHLVFSTKDRVSCIHADILKRLHAYLAGTLAALDCPALAVGGVADHVHLFFKLSKNRALADVVKHLKIESSKWMKEEGGRRLFAWQAGYGAFSVGASQEERIMRYVRDQERHHQKRSFQDELRLLLRRYRVAFDETYVWE